MKFRDQPMRIRDAVLYVVLLLIATLALIYTSREWWPRFAYAWHLTDEKPYQ